MTARAQRHECRAAEHQRNRATGGEPEAVAPGLLPRDDRIGILAGDDERLVAELETRVGRDRQAAAYRLLPRSANGGAVRFDGGSISAHCRYPSAGRCKAPPYWRASRRGWLQLSRAPAAAAGSPPAAAPAQAAAFAARPQFSPA